jgi:phage FluMu protein Com
MIKPIDSEAGIVEEDFDITVNLGHITCPECSSINTLKISEEDGLVFVSDNKKQAVLQAFCSECNCGYSITLNMRD